MSYRNTLQADALKLVAKKLQSSLAVEGELSEDGWPHTATTGVRQEALRLNVPDAEPGQEWAGG